MKITEFQNFQLNTSYGAEMDRWSRLRAESKSELDDDDGDDDEDEMDEEDAEGVATDDSD
jgi:hypothetical protein